MLRTAQGTDVFERSIHAMIVIDDDRRQVAANQAACVLLERPLDSLIGCRFDEMVASSMEPARVEAAWQALLRVGSQSGITQLCMPDGERRQFTYAALSNVAPSRHLCVLVRKGFAAEDGREPARNGGRGDLSVRESETLLLLALGYTGPEIAERLVLSVETVRSHIRSLKEKLQARTLAHLVAVAMTGRLLPEGDPQNW